MKMAASLALAGLAKEEVPKEVKDAVGRDLQFGKEYVIPTPFDPRLLGTVSVAVAKAAMDSGVAKIKIDNLDEYKKRLENPKCRNI